MDMVRRKRTTFIFYVRGTPLLWDLKRWNISFWSNCHSKRRRPLKQGTIFWRHCSTVTKCNIGLASPIANFKCVTSAMRALWHIFSRASTRTKNWEFVRVCTICTSPYPYKNWPSYRKIVLNRTFVDALPQTWSIFLGQTLSLEIKTQTIFVIPIMVGRK